MMAGAALEARKKRSTVMIGGKGQPCQWWMGANTRLGGDKGCRGTGGSCSFYLASPDPNRTMPRASNLSEGPAYQGDIKTGRLKRSF